MNGKDVNNPNPDIKELAAAAVPPKETDAEKTAEEQKALLEKPVSPREAAPPSKETTEIKPEIIRKPKPRCEPRPMPQIPEVAEKWKEKWVEMEGKKILFVPSGFEIITKNGWRPVMTRADKIKK